MKIVLTLRTPLKDLGNPQVSPDLTLRTAALERLTRMFPAALLVQAPNKKPTQIPATAR